MSVSNFLSVVLSLSFVAVSQGQQAGQSGQQQGQAKETLEVLYTSRLLGYLTSDDKAPPPPNTGGPPTCFSDKGADPSGLPSRKSVTQCFLDSLAMAKARYPNALLIGMGDNLAPKYEARFLLNGEPKPRTKTLDLANDNVVKILQLYNAIVPGKEDFYFGAGRLKETASVLPQMNASNLTETVTYKIVTPDPNERPPHGFLSSHPNVKPFDDGHIVLEREDGHKPTYTMQFVVSDTTPPLDSDTPDLNVCQADNPKQCAECAKNHECLSYKGTRISGDPRKSQIATYDISGLNARYHFSDRLLMCFKLNPPSELEEDLEYFNKQGQQFCRPVTVDQRMFPKFPYQKIDGDGKNLVIISAVDPEIKKTIPSYNQSWEPRDEKGNKKDDVQVEVAFSDPASSIRQAYYECRFNQRKDKPECDENTEVLLLAQTTLLSTAEKLPGKLSDLKNLRLVVTNDPQPSVFGEKMDYRDTGRSVPVIATRVTYFQGQDCDGNPAADKTAVDNPLHFISVNVSPKDNKKPTLTHALRVPNAKDPDAKDQDWCYTRRSAAPGNAFLDKRIQDLKSHGAQKVESFLVEQMRSRMGGDVALISQHEVFRDPDAEKLGDDDAALKQRVVRLVWEGAHIHKLRLTGKKLREALKASASAPTDHGLIMSGVVPSDDKNFYINSRPLDDNGGYTVIAADALILGDPSYTALADETFQERDSPSEETLGTLVCQALGTTCLDSGKERSIVVLHSGLKQPAHNHLFGYLASVIAPLAHDPLPHLADKCEPGKPCADKCQQGKPCDKAVEKSAQLRPMWFANLLKNNLSYSLTKAHPNDQVVGSEFGGVTDPRVLKAHTESNSVDHDLRVGYSWQHYAVGVEETIQFGRNRQGSTNGNPDAVTLTANKGTIGPFFEWGFKHNAVPYWRLVLRPVDFSDNFARTIAVINGAKNAVGKATTFTENLPAQRSIGSKAGLRFEAPQRADSLLAAEGPSFLEAGFKSTNNINLPTQLTLNPNSATPVPCSLVDAKESLAACAKPVVATDGAIITRFDNNRQNGGYWTGIFRFPITQRLTYKLQSDGDVRPGGGTSAETHYAITVDNFLQTRLWGNLGLAPHIGWFFYENQVDHNDLIRHTIDVTLTYNFNWHQGLSWRAFFTGPGVGH